MWVPSEGTIAPLLVWGPNHAGIRCPHQSWRDTHQGWIFSIQLKKVFSHVLGTISIRPSRTACIGANASFSASTYHWSVSHGSITTPERSPKGRSEEHTSELQSLIRTPYAVFCLKKTNNEHMTH